MEELCIIVVVCNSYLSILDDDTIKKLKEPIKLTCWQVVGTSVDAEIRKSAKHSLTS